MITILEIYIYMLLLYCKQVGGLKEGDVGYLWPAFLVSDLCLVLQVHDELVLTGHDPGKASSVRGGRPDGRR